MFLKLFVLIMHLIASEALQYQGFDWYVGAVGQICDTVCVANSLRCTAQILTDSRAVINTAQAVTDLATALGRTCTSTAAERLGPSILNDGQCDIWNGNPSFSGCGAGGTAVSRFCPCSPPATASPSRAPTLAAPADPTADPSLAPTLNPSANPTLDPTADPKVNPTANPSADPTANPTANPTADPTLAPTVNPTLAPTVNPTATPSTDPTANPTAHPTLAPTAAPTLAPTANPSPVPTFRPTAVADKLTQLTLAVEQTVYFMAADEYFAQQVAYNTTIQNTVAASMEGVVPERVTDIFVEEIPEGSERSYAAVKTCFLAYKVTVHDPLLSYEVLREQLMQAAATGKMDNDLRHYAEMFGLPELANGTFSVPLIANTVSQRSAKKKLTGAQIACLIIGIFMFFALLATATLYLQQRKHREAAEPTAVESTRGAEIAGSQWA